VISIIFVTYLALARLFLASEGGLNRSQTRVDCHLSNVDALRREVQSLYDAFRRQLFRVGDRRRLQPLSHEAGARDGGAAAKHLEARLHDPISVPLDLDAHYRAFIQRSNFTSANVVAVERPDPFRIAHAVQYFF
jgi:hypothetical protein